ncbi:PAS domain S-box protein [Mesorhizobium sp. B1-1-8]|uniref:sensor histidine kinase n=1 Tax=Mesorhizobium sp. B1-1-8 TaxID=2589976 RepID=UPI00299F8CE1|nr:PAS domain S-box protein [Mesorhizobium sp. B1-1-8]
MLATLLFEAKAFLAGGADLGFLEFVPAIVIIAFLEDRWPAVAATVVMVAVGLGVRTLTNGQLRAEDWARAILLLLSGGMIAFLFHRSKRSLREALDVRLAAVEAAESRYRRAFERAAMGFATANAKGELLWLNRRLCGMSGYGEGDLVGRQMETLIHPDDSHSFMKSLRALSADTPSFGSEIRLIRQDGSTFWARLTLSLSTPETVPSDSVFVVVDDITEPRAAREALVAQKAWLDLALSAGRLGTWRIDYDEGVISGSSQFWEILGLPQAALHSLDDMQVHVHPADWPKLASPPARDASATNYDAEIRLRRANGQIRWIALRGRQENRNGHNQRIGVAADLTERTQTILLRAAVRKQERLMLEQRHRFSNLFPVIAAVVNLVDAPDDNLVKYKETLLERIRVLQATHLLLLGSANASATVHDLVLQELRPFAEAGRTAVTGPQIKISSGAAESFAMIVHELTTNSVKHGVLGSSQGKVEVRWAFASSPEGEVVFEWIETGHPSVSPITRHGFGSMVLGADGTPLVGHSSKLEMTDGGLRYSLRLSRKEIQA